MYVSHLECSKCSATYSTPLTGRASPYTIDAATTPWRGFAEQTPLPRSRDGVSCIMRARSDLAANRIDMEDGFV